jgi:hypothetical protein
MILIEQSASRPKASALASELGVADGFEVGEAVDDQQVGPSVREPATDASSGLLGLARSERSSSYADGPPTDTERGLHTPKCGRWRRTAWSDA